MEHAQDTRSDIQREVDELELSLLRRGIDERLAHSERCARCRRTPLVGERVYMRSPEAIVCELCHFSGDDFAGTRVIHTPAFGHTIRIVDQRAA